MPGELPAVTYLVLCGGSSRRFGGGDKTRARLGRGTVLDHLLDSLPAGAPVVCVGTERPTARRVTWTRESPPLGGPVAAIAAGLQVVRTPSVVVVAGDMPYAASAVPALLTALSHHPEADSAVAVDRSGRAQSLLGAHRTQALRDGIPDEPGGTAARRVLGGLSVIHVPVDDLVAADVDTRDDLDRLRARTGRPEDA